MQWYNFSAKAISYVNEKGFVILKGILSGRRCNAKGYIPEFRGLKRTKIDMDIQLFGKITQDEYGRVIKFKAYKLPESSKDFVFHFLKSMKGVGEKLARKIIKHFGKDIVKVLREKPELLAQVEGIGRGKANLIKMQWQEYVRFVQLRDFLKQFDLPVDIIGRVFNIFKGHDDIVGYIMVNPYVLCSVLDFRVVDDIALSLGFKEKSVRIRAALIYLLEQVAMNNGDTFILVDNLFMLLNNLITNKNDISKNDFLQVLQRYNGRDFYVADNMVGLIRYIEQETYIWDELIKRKRKIDIFKDADIKRHILQFEKSAKLKLSDEQRDAIFTVVKNGFSIITGYAGTGKTTVTKVIATLFREVFGDEQVIGCAMSGIASRRLGEAAGIKAQTIHSLLGYNGYSFAYDTQRKLPYIVYIVDECGMIDLDLFSAFLSALPDDTILILVGDDAQLPPIGAGNFFHDIVKQSDKMPVVRLNKIFRQTDGNVINIFAGQVREGKIPQDYLKTHPGWSFMDTGGGLAERILSQDKVLSLNEHIKVYNLLLRVVQRALSSERITDFNRQFQVLAPIKEGVMGTINLNSAIQDLIDKAHPKGRVSVQGYTVDNSSVVFRVGDKVVHLVNKDIPFSEIGNLKDMRIERIYNGTLGVITDISFDYEIVKVQIFSGGYVYYRFSELGVLVQPAYCLTVHKVQGSEFDYVVIPLVDSYMGMLNNQWLYTAITRAKKGIVFIGDKELFEYACSNMEAKYRQTFMQYRFEHTADLLDGLEFLIK